MSVRVEEKCMCRPEMFDKPDKRSVGGRTWCETCGYVYLRDKGLTGSRAVFKIDGKEIKVFGDVSVESAPSEIFPLEMGRTLKIEDLESVMSSVTFDAKVFSRRPFESDEEFRTRLRSGNNLPPLMEPEVEENLHDPDFMPELKKL